jgi:glycosyltransferase involved in cell wall biosynthesis
MIGGGERYALELARAQAAQRRVRLVSLGPVAERRVEPGGLEVVRRRASWFLRGNISNPVALGVVEELRDAAVIHVHQFNTLLGNLAHLCARVLGVPIFYTDLAGGGWNLEAWFPLIRRADGHLAISQFAADYVAEAHAVPRDALRVIYGGVDLERYSYRPPTRRRRHAVYLGRLVPHKGVENLLEGLPEGWTADIIGTPYDRRYGQELRRRAAGRAVIFREGVGDNDVRAILRTASCLVLPTRDQGRRPELLGLVLLEAQALGTPVIATRVGALPEVIQHNVTGLLVPPDDPEALSKALRRLESEATRVRLAEAARARLEERFTWRKAAEACLSAYADLGGRRPGAGG